MDKTPIILLAVILLTACTGQPSDLAAACQDAGGELKEFPNSCVDSCELERNAAAISCATVLTQGCDCGPDKCWNGQSCESN